MSRDEWYVLNEALIPPLFESYTAYSYIVIGWCMRYKAADSQKLYIKSWESFNSFSPSPKKFVEQKSYYLEL